MLGVLESLEEGVPYQKDHPWSDNMSVSPEGPGFYLPDPRDLKYNFQFALSEFSFNEKDLEEIELKMEEFSKRLEQKMEEMARHLDSVLKAK